MAANNSTRLTQKDIVASVRRRDLDKLNELNMLLAQLSAQLSIIYGAGYESFEQYSDEIKNDYFWAMYCHAKRARDLSESL